eukprot:5392425-Prymnesium_polylepis.1
MARGLPFGSGRCWGQRSRQGLGGAPTTRSPLWFRSLLGRTAARISCGWRLFHFWKNSELAYVPGWWPVTRPARIACGPSTSR